MKTIYIDVILLFNFCVDFVLLYLAGAFLCIKTSVVRLVVSSLFGALSAAAVEIISPGSVLRIVLSFVILEAMCYMAYGKVSVRAAVKQMTLIYLLGFVLCGMANVLVGDGVYTVPLCIAVMLLLYKPLFAILRNRLSKSTVDALITYDEKKVNVRLLSDSGNLLYDKETCLPVVVVSERVKEIIQVRSQDLYDIPIVTASGEGNVKAVRNTKIYIIQKHKQIQLSACVAFGKVAGDCDGVISNMLCDNI